MSTKAQVHKWLNTMDDDQLILFSWLFCEKLLPAYVPYTTTNEQILRKNVIVLQQAVGSLYSLLVGDLRDTKVFSNHINMLAKITPNEEEEEPDTNHQLATSVCYAVTEAMQFVLVRNPKKLVFMSDEGENIALLMQDGKSKNEDIIEEEMKRQLHYIEQINNYNEVSKPMIDRLKELNFSDLKYWDTPQS